MNKDVEKVGMNRRDFLKTAGVTLGAIALPRRLLDLKLDQAPRLESTLVEDLVFLSEKTEKCKGSFVTEASLVVEDFPLHYDENYNLNKPVTIHELPSGLNLSFNDFYYFRDPSTKVKNQEIVRATILPDTMGTHDLMTAVLDRGQFDFKGKYVPALKNYEGIKEKDDEIYGGMTYWVGDGSIYPNKIFNLITAFGNILKYQEKYGPLKKGYPYSYTNMIQLPSSDQYLKGYNSSYMRVRAGGVCAGSTILANAIYRMAEKTGVHFDDTYIEPRVAHDLRYPLGPFAPKSYITDTTVWIDSEGVRDFRMVPPAECYISPKFCLIPNGVPTEETSSDGLGILDKDTGKYTYSSDVTLLLNVAFTKNPPEETSRGLFEVKQEYADFRDTRRRNRPYKIGIKKMMGGAQLVGNYKWEEKKPNNIIESIFPSVDLNVEPFSENIKTNPYLQESFTLMKMLNSVDQNSSPDVSAFVRNSDWYRKKEKDGLLTSKLESGIDQLGYLRIQGQPVQCIQWVNFLTTLGYPECPINMGAAIRGPNDLIPDRILVGSHRGVASSRTGGVIIADPKLKIEELKAGNLFLIKNSDVGHVGFFLATKDVDGKRLVLGTDANRENDGRIRIFTLEDRNFDLLWGAPPKKKIILVKNNS